jgi:acetolactate synthase I/II/III large subunit
VEGTPGPALLVIPMDMISKHVADPKPLISRPVPLPVAESSQIEDAASIIAKAQRPIVVVDEGAAWGDAGEGLKAIAALGIPVLGNSLGRGLVPETEPTGFPWPYAQRAAALADVVIVVGAKMTMWFGYGKSPRFGENAYFIHIDKSPEGISRNVVVDMPIVAHPGKTIGAIASKLKEAGFKHEPQWLVDALVERKERISSFVDNEEQPLHQIEIGSTLEKVLPEDRIVVCDGADILNFTFGRLRVYRPRSKFIILFLLCFPTCHHRKFLQLPSCWSPDERANCY